MKILPSEKITLKALIPIEEIERKLHTDIEPPKFRFNYSGKRKFEGQISDFRFKITPLTNYRNAFSPVVKGYLSKNESETLIHLDLRLHPAILISTILWNCVVLITSIGMAFVQIKNKTFDPVTLVIIIFLLNGILLPIYGFNKDRKIILDYFELNFCNPNYKAESSFHLEKRN